MSSRSKKTTPVHLTKHIDDLTQKEIEERLEKTLYHINAIEELWPGLVSLPEQERRKSIGRNVSMLGPALRSLLFLIIPKDGKETPLARLFHVLGEEDHGSDPERFEAELLLRRLDRIEAEQKVQEELDALCRKLGDDVLSTGEMVIGPGMLALHLARSVARGNAAHRSALSPVLNALGEMTKRARQRKAEQQREKGKAPASSETP